MATPKQAAEWMLARIEEEGELRQQDAVVTIKKQFGAEFVYTDADGNPAIDRRVLYQFRKITKESVLWVARQDNYLEGFWRKRDRSDAPGRKQSFW
jgi:hypothetical protein